MGNAASQAVVTCERPHYASGDTVRGVVAFQSSKEVHTTGVELKITGYEKCKWEDSETHSVGGRTETRWVTRDAERKFFKVTVPLGPAGTLPAGQLQWGFAFALPPGLPSNFSYHKGNVKAEVVYKVKAVIHTAGTFKSKIKGKQHLAVTQREYVPPKPAIASGETPMMVCWCFNKGHASANIAVDRDRYMPGETANIILQADNQSSERFTSVDVKLKQRIVLYAEGHRKKITNTVASRTFEGIPPYATLQGGMARHIPLQLAASLPPSTSGQIVQCDYYVSVTLKTGGFVGLFISDLKMRVPVVIFPPPPPPDMYFAEPPPGWAPTQVYAPVAVDVPSAPPLPPDALTNASFWGRAGMAPTAGQGPPPPPTF